MKVKYTQRMPMPQAPSSLQHICPQALHYHVQPTLRLATFQHKAHPIPPFQTPKIW